MKQIHTPALESVLVRFLAKPAKKIRGIANGNPKIIENSVFKILFTDLNFGSAAHRVA